MVSAAIICGVLLAVLPLVRSCPAVGESGNYGGGFGSDPDGWGSIPGYETCGTGSSQSPIDVITAGSYPLPTEPTTNYNVATMELMPKVENWALQCQSPNSCGSISYNGQTYSVFSLHFHVRSDHKIDGKEYSLEAQVVHLNGGDIKVMAFLFETGLVSNPLASLIINSICLGSKEITVALDLFVDSSDGMCSYSGSLTTPPCSEGVQYFVQRKILKISQIDLDRFITTFNSPTNSNNNRPLADLNGRPIMCSS